MSDEPIRVTIIEEPEEDPVRVTIGDTNMEVTQRLLQAHREENTPHTAYDDMTSLTLLFENGLL